MNSSTRLPKKLMDIFLFARLTLIIKSVETDKTLAVCDFLLSFALFDSNKKNGMRVWFPLSGTNCQVDSVKTPICKGAWTYFWSRLSSCRKTFC